MSGVVNINGEEVILDHSVKIQTEEGPVTLSGHPLMCEKILCALTFANDHGFAKAWPEIVKNAEEHLSKEKEQ